jgi:hypothetical protein
MNILIDFAACSVGTIFDPSNMFLSFVSDE